VAVIEEVFERPGFASEIGRLSELAAAGRR
jgi:hypothetical protein